MFISVRSLPQLLLMSIVHAARCSYYNYLTNYIKVPVSSTFYITEKRTDIR